MSTQSQIAANIAAYAHRDQFRRDGVTSYLEHVLDVAERLKKNNEPDEVVAAGLLHDVIEDSAITFNDLREAGISDVVLVAVDLLTKRKDKSYDEYLKYIKEYRMARKVKIADMLSNLADDPTPKQVEKYVRGLHYLLGFSDKF